MENIPYPPRQYMELVCGKVPDLREKFEWAGEVIAQMLEDEDMINADVSFLDVGCGCGRLARYLLEKPLASYTGFDRHPGMIEWCKKEISSYKAHFSFHCFEIKSIYSKLDDQDGIIEAVNFRFPFGESAFDSILLASVFTHMPMLESIHYLTELYRTLKPEGKLMLSVFFSGDDEHSVDVNFFYNKEAFLQSIEQIGFKYNFREELHNHNWYVLRKK